MIDPIRKAAILITTLDRRMADALLDQMSEQQADQIRRAAFELEQIDPIEQDRVIAEFLGRTESPTSPAAAAVPATTLRSAVSSEPAALSRAAVSSPFGFLHDADSRKLVSFLEGEHPQTIAVVVSHLPSHRAMGLLASLSSSLQADVLRRLVSLEEADPEIISEVERGLEARISRHIRMEQRRTAGLHAVVNILAAADRAVERQIMVNLSRHAPDLARQLPRTSPDFVFEDLALLDSVTLGVLMQQADPQIATLALAGCSSELVERVLRSMPLLEAEELRNAWLHLGPTPLSDVEAAQRAIVELAEHLDAEGRIELPLTNSLRLSAA